MKLKRQESGGSGGGGCGTVALGVAELAEFGRHVPDGEAWMCVENGIDVPTLGSCYGYQRLIACLSPSSHIFAPFFENPPQ